MLGIVKQHWELPECKLVTHPEMLQAISVQGRTYRNYHAKIQCKTIKPKPYTKRENYKTELSDKTPKNIYQTKLIITTIGQNTQAYLSNIPVRHKSQTILIQPFFSENTHQVCININRYQLLCNLTKKSLKLSICTNIN